jgi:hypothetical protein
VLPNPTFAFALFLSSYSPAFLIIAVRSFDNSWGLFWVALGLTATTAGAFLIFIKVVRGGGPFLGKIEEIDSRDSDLAAYVATYLLPFVLVPSATVQDVIALGLFLFFIGLLWVNSGMIYLNPLLSLAGYRLFMVDARVIGGGTLPRSYLLSRQLDLAPGDELQINRIVAGVLIDLSPRHSSTGSQSVPSR